MAKFEVRSIGKVAYSEGEMRIVLDKAYAKALTGLEGFSHLQVLWWFSEDDDGQGSHAWIENNPYKKGPAMLGTFATRSPRRPNKIALSSTEITYVDVENAAIGIAYIDAFHGTPVLDIKPYTPSLDRVENPAAPKWCSHWPKSYEASGMFDWESEMKE